MKLLVNISEQSFQNLMNGSIELHPNQVVDIISGDDLPQKTDLLKLLAKEDPQVLGLAYLYARCIARDGADVTEKWLTATEQSQMLERAYTRGRNDGINSVLDTVADQCKGEDNW